MIKLNLLTIAVWLFFGLIALAILAHFLAEFRKKRFKQDYIYLKSAIENSMPDVDSYIAIMSQYDQLDCYSDADLHKKAKLHSSIEEKYKNIILVLNGIQY